MIRLSRMLPSLALIVTLAGCGSSGSSTHSSASLPAVPTETASVAGSAHPSAPATTIASPATSSAAPSPAESASPSAATPSYQPVALHTTTHKSTAGSVALTISTETVDSVSGVPANTARAIAALLSSSSDAAVSLAKTSDVKPPTSATPPNSLTNAVDVVEADTAYVSVVLSSYSYTGGAHGGTALAITTVRRDTGATVPTSALIASGHSASFYATLRTALENALPAIVGDGMTASDFAKDVTVKSVTRTPVFPRTDGLEVVFDEYQVASYAMGHVYVVIPWSAFGGDLNTAAIPTSPVAAPAMRGGTFVTSLSKSAIAAIGKSTAASLKGLNPTGYTLVGPTVVQPVSSSGSADGAYLLVQLVPTAKPGSDLTVTLSENASARRASYTIVAAGHGAAGCTGIRSDVAAASALAC